MPTYATPLSQGKTSPKGFNRILGRLFTQSGVIANGLEVSAQGSPDMTVKVAGSLLDDNAVFIHSDGHFIEAWNSSDVNVSIGSNSSGSGKVDAIVAYVDVDDFDASNANNPDAFKFKAIRGSSGAPSSGEIEADSEVDDNPYIILAHVAVADGATSINSGNITDQRPRATVDGQRLGDESVDTNQIADEAAKGPKIGPVTTTSTYNLALNNASITSLVTTAISGSSTSNPSIARCEGTLNITGLSIGSSAKILEAHFWVNAAGNNSNTGYYPLEVTALSNTSLAFKGVMMGDGSGGNNFPNVTNSKLQGYIRYIP